MFGKLPFWANNEMEFVDTIKTMDLTFPEDIPCSDELKLLLRQLLEKDPKKRITLNEIKVIIAIKIWCFFDIVCLLTLYYVCIYNFGL